MRISAPVMLIMLASALATSAQAQTMRAIETRPWIPPPPQPPPPPPPAVSAAANPVPSAAPVSGEGETVATGSLPAGLPVVMFTATRVPASRADAEPEPAQEPPRYSITWQAERDALARVQPPPPVDVLSAGASANVPARDSRGPFRRIWEDTRTGVVRDIPEALASALPWVDRTRRDEPFESVLARVSDELERASQADPEWALKAEDEIRELSARLQRLPEPPPRERAAPASLAGAPDPADPGRPFRVRPVWPGISPSTVEAGVRPVAIHTAALEQDGAPVRGVRRPLTADPETALGEPVSATPAPAPAPRRGPARQNRRR